MKAKFALYQDRVIFSLGKLTLSVTKKIIYEADITQTEVDEILKVFHR